MSERTPKHNTAQTEEEYRIGLRELDLTHPLFTSTPEAPVDWCTLRGAVQSMGKLLYNPDRVEDHVEYEIPDNA